MSSLPPSFDGSSPTQLGYQPVEPHTATGQQLQVISVLWFVLAGLTALASLVPIIHVVIGVMFLIGTFNQTRTFNQTGTAPPPDFIGYLFLGFGLLFIAIGLAFAACMVLTGVRLRQRRSRVFCIVVSALACTAFPFGTALGVWTLVVLTRRETLELFIS